MKIKLLILAFIFSPALFGQHDHSAQHAKKSSTTKHPNTSVKFKATSDLKVRMEKIEKLVTSLKKSDDKKLIVEAGNKIASVVDDIIKTCKLEPAADEAVHPVLARILEGSDDLKHGHYEKGVHKVHEAFNDYHKTFSH